MKTGNKVKFIGNLNQTNSDGISLVNSELKKLLSTCDKIYIVRLPGQVKLQCILKNGLLEETYYTNSFVENNFCVVESFFSKYEKDVKKATELTEKCESLKNVNFNDENEIKNHINKICKLGKNLQEEVLDHIFVNDVLLNDNEDSEKAIEFFTNRKFKKVSNVIMKRLSIEMPHLFKEVETV